MDYLQEKELLLGSILENTQAQTKLIEDENMDALEELISKRQTLMNQVDVLDQEAGDLVDEMTSKQAAPLKSLLSQIMTIDHANQSLMKKELEHVQGELLKIRVGRKQGEHYGTEYGLYKEEGVFFDTKE